MQEVIQVDRGGIIEEKGGGLRRVVLKEGTSSAKLQGQMRTCTVFNSVCQKRAS